MAVAAVSLGVGLSGVFASQSLAAPACSASTRALAGFAGPGACAAQVKCTSAVCRYLVRIHVDATFAAGHSGQIKGQAKWAAQTTKRGSVGRNGALACTASGSYQRSCDDAMVADALVNDTLRMVCAIPATLIPVRWVSARITCSFARI
jgi:hypothetical protein